MPIHVGESGARLRRRIRATNITTGKVEAFDLTAATVTFYFRAPNSSTKTLATTITSATGGIVDGFTTPGFLHLAGAWKWWAKVVNGAGTWYTEAEVINVEAEPPSV